MSRYFLTELPAFRSGAFRDSQTKRNFNLETLIFSSSAARKTFTSRPRPCTRSYNRENSGDSRDKRIDAYSAEIIGILLHYDEIHQWNSPFHDRIFRILKEFCDSNLALIDTDGKYAKWGRSLRGEAEVKKIFLWKFVQTRNLTTSGDAAAQHLFRFFLKTGIRADGKIGRDKAFDSGIWDEYTTHVQAQGYGIYGLAMALRFASGEHAEESSALPSESEDYVRTLPGPAILCANDHRTGVHYILPAGNRITKNMEVGKIQQ